VPSSLRSATSCSTNAEDDSDSAAPLTIASSMLFKDTSLGDCIRGSSRQRRAAAELWVLKVLVHGTQQHLDRYQQALHRSQHNDGDDPS